MKKLLKNILAICFGLFLGGVLGEIILRIYNPIPYRVKGDKIILPANQRYIINNNSNNKFDNLITHTKNSLGFRGGEPPKNFNDWVTFVAVGGSTTECYYLNDGKDWVSLLGNKLSKKHENTWINNAGLDGHSTFGHDILLKDYLQGIKPNYIIYLVGCNDVGRGDLNVYEKDVIRGNSNNSFSKWIKTNSELIGLTVNLIRAYKADNMDLLHKEVILGNLKHSDFKSEELKKQLQIHQPMISSFHDRMSKLVEDTKQKGITPVLVTQPTLVGEGIDPVTKVNLETINLPSQYGGKLYWSILEKYNDETRLIAKKHDLLLVDLAKRMPKNSRFYYDYMHYTNEGAEKVSEIIFEEIDNLLQLNKD